jgi:molybdopterin-guanine dinucleotide biosynthesis protein A
MGADKALLVYAGEPQIVRAVRLLAGFCERVLVAVRPDRAADPRYAGFELVIDDPGDAGPAAGLLAAWRALPGAALLVLAVDLPLVDAPLVQRLLAARAAQRVATAFAHPDGTLEPLCTIWEPSAHEIVRAAARNSSVSLRKVLEAEAVGRVELRDAARLRSVNTPEDYASFRSQLDL